MVYQKIINILELYKDLSTLKEFLGYIKWIKFHDSITLIS